MRIFLRVAELASFTRAAEGLGLPKATVSQAVQQLEQWTGTRLLQRTTRKVNLTQDGAVFYERCRDLVADLEEVEGMFRGAAGLRGRLRLDMPVRLALHAVLPRLPEFLRRHPQLELEISSTDRRVDVIQEGFDCVVRVGHPGESSLVVQRLGDMDVLNCASPAYLESYGTPRTLEDLAQHRLIHYSASLGSRPLGFEYATEDGYATVAMQGAVTVNHSEAYLALCLAGLGLIQVPRQGVETYLQRGELVEVLPQLRSEPMPISLIYPVRRNLSRRVKVLLDWLQQILSDYLKN